MNRWCQEGTKTMDQSDKKGEFTSSLFRLQLEIKTLLEGAGGDGASALLDRLSGLSRSEQAIVLKVFSRVVDKILEGDERVFSTKDIELKRFEEGLYREILDSMRKAANTSHNYPFEVVDGGKVNRPSKHNKLIDFEKIREERGKKPLLN